MSLNLKILSVFIFLNFTGLTLYSQTDSIIPGKLTIHSDTRLDSLVRIHKKINEEKQSMPGYRVQLFFGAERKKANDIKTSFLLKYPEIPAYVLYHQPNYKVRVGDFRTRLEAWKLYQELNAEFPSSFVVKDEIALPLRE